MSKIALALAAAGGYVLGAKAGRERYDQIQQQASRLWSDPRVQKAKAQARDTAAEAAVSAKDTVQEKVQDVRSSDSGSGSDAGSNLSSAPASAPAHSVPTPADMPEHPGAPGTVAGGPSDAS